MKYLVKVGKDFPCYEAADPNPPSLVVNVTNQVARPEDVLHASGKRRQRVRWEFAVLGSALMLTAPATLYGMATGDFSPLRSIAEVGRDVVQFGAQLLRPK